MREAFFLGTASDLLSGKPILSAHSFVINWQLIRGGDDRKKDFMIQFQEIMWPEKISNPGPLALQSDTLQTVLRDPAMADYHIYL